MDPSFNWGDLYKKWLDELCEKAKSGKSQYLEKNYERAANSIKRAKITTETPNELTKLSGVGKKTAELLTKLALKHCKDNALSEDWFMPASTTTRAAPEAPKTSTRNYVPKFGSTPYHVLCGIRQLERSDSHASGFGRDAILRQIKPKLMENNGGSYQKLLPSLTPALTQLTKHAYMFSRSRQYFLEDKGRELADKFLGVEKSVRLEHGSTISSDPAGPSDQAPVVRRFTRPEDFASSIWQHGDYNLHLLLDNREISTSENRTGFQEALEALGVSIVVLPLSVGDCCWVVEHKTSHRRAILDTIIERKRLDDLVASIIDGRFQEQKRRLDKSCLPHVVYLIENAGGDSEFRERHQQRISTAVSQIMVQHRFHYRETDSQAETVAYFAQMMEAISMTLKDKPITVIHPNISSYEKSMEKAVEVCQTESFAVDYDSFLEATQKSRNKTIAEIFMLMLMAVRGVSAEKAMVIQSIYKTPRGLIEAYSRIVPSQRPTMLYDATANLPTRRRVDEEISAKVCQQWSQGVSKLNLNGHSMESQDEPTALAPDKIMQQVDENESTQKNSESWDDTQYDGESPKIRVSPLVSVQASPKPSFDGNDLSRNGNFEVSVTPASFGSSEPTPPKDDPAPPAPQTYPHYYSPNGNLSPSILDSPPNTKTQSVVIDIHSDSPSPPISKRAPFDSFSGENKRLRDCAGGSVTMPATREPVTIDLLSMESDSSNGCEIIDLC